MHRLSSMRWAAVVALLAAISLSFVATPAYAVSSPPGGESSWHPELAQGTQIQTPDTMHQAYADDGTKVQVWRGMGDQVWMSINGGQPFNPGDAAVTYVAPDVIPLGSNGIGVFHITTSTTRWASIRRGRLEAAMFARCLLGCRGTARHGPASGGSQTGGTAYSSAPTGIESTDLVPGQRTLNPRVRHCDVPAAGAHCARSLRSVASPVRESRVRLEQRSFSRRHWAP